MIAGVLRSAWGGQTHTETTVTPTAVVFPGTLCHAVAVSLDFVVCCWTSSLAYRLLGVYTHTQLWAVCCVRWWRSICCSLLYNWSCLGYCGVLPFLLIATHIFFCHVAIEGCWILPLIRWACFGSHIVGTSWLYSILLALLDEHELAYSSAIYTRGQIIREVESSFELIAMLRRHCLLQILILITLFLQILSCWLQLSCYTLSSLYHQQPYFSFLSLLTLRYYSKFPPPPGFICF